MENVHFFAVIDFSVFNCKSQLKIVGNVVFCKDKKKF